MQLRRAFQTLPIGAIAGGAPAVGNAILFTVMGDSLTVSRGTDNLDENRTGSEPEVVGAMQYVNYSDHDDYQTLSADVSPLWHPDDGVARISPFEDFLREYVELTDKTPIMVPCGTGGTWLSRSGTDEDWDPATPGTRLVAAKNAHNAAMGLAAEGTTVGAIFVDLTSNDYIGGSYDTGDIVAAWLDLIDYVRANFDGVSDSTPIILAGPCASGDFSIPREDIEYAATQRINVFVEHPPYPTADPSNLHPIRSENAAWGAALADLVDTVLTGSQAIPTFSTAATQNATQGDQLAVAIDHTGLDGASKYGFVEINGGDDAAEFEIGGTWPNQVLRWAEDGEGPEEEGEYVVNLRIRNGAWEYGSDYPVTVSVAAVGETSPVSFFTTERGMVWDLSDTATLFQDIAGTTPVTAAGQPVGRVNDLSGNDNHWIAAANNTTRPTYQVDGDGKPYLQFDGSNDILFASVPFVTPGSDIRHSACVGLFGSAQASERAVLGSYSTSTTTPFVEPLVFKASSASTYGLRNDASGGFSPAAGTVAGVLDNTTKKVMSAHYNGTNSTMRQRDAGQRPVGGGDGYSTPGGWSNTIGTIGTSFTVTRAALGGRGFNSPTGFFNGRIYSGFVINRFLTDAEVKAGEDWVAARQLTSALP